jgi:hypothetical protein
METSIGLQPHQERMPIVSPSLIDVTILASELSRYFLGSLLAMRIGIELIYSSRTT